VATNAKRSKSGATLRLVRGGRQSAPPEGPTDDELCEAVARGDRQTGELLYDRLIGVVDGTLCRIVGRREDDHDDLVQSAFEQILLSLTRRRFGGRCSLASWAGSIATNVGLNAIRSRQRQRKVVDRRRDAYDVPEVGTGTTTAEQQLAARHDLERVRTHLAAIDERKATAVLLHDAFGHDLGEVATLTGVSVSAAQSRLIRGRRELHKRLELDEPPDSGRKEAR
jgi:RNA polymerase sigma-70 factor (ECF subfamily)